MKAVRKRDLDNNEYAIFCNKYLEKLSNHWIFKSNQIFFEKDFMISPIDLNLCCKIKLKNIEISTHDNFNN